MSDLAVKIIDLNGKETGTMDIDIEALGGKVRRRLLKDIIIQYEANRRQGSSNTRRRGEIRTTSAKPFRQKGTGRARAGTRASNIWRGGSVAHGPKPRDFHKDIPVKMRRRALGSAILGKILDGELRVVESLEFTEPKTKRAVAVADALGLDNRTLVANHEVDDDQLLSFRNLPWIQTIHADDLNAYSVVLNKYLVISKAGLEELISRVDLRSKEEASS